MKYSRIRIVSQRVKSNEAVFYVSNFYEGFRRAILEGPLIEKSISIYIFIRSKGYLISIRKCLLFLIVVLALMFLNINLTWECIRQPRFKGKIWRGSIIVKIIYK